MAEKKFFVDINLQGNKLVNGTVGANSSMTKAGSFGFNESNSRLEYFNGSTLQEIANLSDISAVTGGLILQGGYDADTNTPNITDGTALKGFFWVVTVAGSFLGESVQIGDSIIAKIDEAGATLSDWLILQGNVVIATDTVDGISRLATQTEANDGTEGGAVVITPATLQGKIDAQITPAINTRLPYDGGTMSGNIDFNNTHGILNANVVGSNQLKGNELINYDNADINLKANLDAENSATIVNLPAPTNDGDATNKLYVDNASNDKLPLSGGTMSGSVDMGGNNLSNAGTVASNTVYTNEISAREGNHSIIFDLENGNVNLVGVNKITNLSGVPTENTDITNKTYVDGAASTAQANAEAYTDMGISQEITNRNNAIKALSFTGTIQGTSSGASGWIYDGVSEYYTYVNHNLNNKWNVVTTTIGEQTVEFNVQMDGLNDVLLRTNIEPVDDTIVSIVNAGGNL